MWQVRHIFMPNNTNKYTLIENNNINNRVLAKCFGHLKTLIDILKLILIKTSYKILL